MSEEKELEALRQEIVEQWSHEELVKLVLRQQKLIERLEQEIENLKEKHSTNSKTSSKPPSSDLLEKSEKAKIEKKEEGEEKRTPGGQPGHAGKTRKGFGRVDRYEISNPYECEHCGSTELSEIIGYNKQQVACLAARPIEVVEYQRAKCQCLECGALAQTCVNLGNPHLQLLFSHPTSEGFKGCPDLHRFIGPPKDESVYGSGWSLAQLMDE